VTATALRALSSSIPHWSLNHKTRFAKIYSRNKLKDQFMLKKLLFALALAGSVLVPTPVHAVTFSQNFSTNPTADGWEIFGDTNLFQWNSTNQNLEVTWDSTKSNSFFHLPLGMTLTRNDDFSIEFDLNLSDIASGVEPGKTGPLQLGFGFLNSTNAMSANFKRGSYGDAPNVAEFDYYPYGFYDYGGVIYEAPAATTPSFILEVNSIDYSPIVISVYNNELPTNQPVHVTFSYTASNQTAVVIVTTNGASTASLPALVLTSANGFEDSDEFHVDMFSVSSYSSAGNDFDSVLAHGTVDNIVVTLPPPVQNLTGAFSNGVWQAQFNSYSNWLFTLERTTNLISWEDVSLPTGGNRTNLLLQDTNAVLDKAFYRVRAARP